MDPTRPYRPRVSRETRLLLTTALVAVAALWVLARIRFPDLPATPNPVPPLLTQLATTPTFDGLASEVTQLQSRLEPLLLALDANELVSMPEMTPRGARLTALRLRDDLALAFMTPVPAREHWVTDRVVAADPATGFVVVRVPVEPPVSPPAPWAPRRLDRPRVLMTTDIAAARVALRPVFLGALDPVANAYWSESIWSIPAHTDVAPGSFVFSTAGDLAGMVIAHASGRAIVPTAILLSEVERLVERSSVPAGDLGIRVQGLTSDVAAATGAIRGVVVTSVDAAGPAAGLLAIADVIESADAQIVWTPEHWYVRVARLGSGDVLTLQVRRGGELRAIKLRATIPAPSPSDGRSLGLRMRRAPGAGTEILGVDTGSAGARAGLAAGDVVTLVGDVASPTPAQVRETYGAARDGRPVLVGVTRGGNRFVTTLPR
jgi:PDZ domain